MRDDDLFRHLVVPKKEDASPVPESVVAEDDVDILVEESVEKPISDLKFETFSDLQSYAMQMMKAACPEVYHRKSAFGAEVDFPATDESRRRDIEYNGLSTDDSAYNLRQY